MVSARRLFEGLLPLGEMSRLAGYLADREGECVFALEFGRDALGIAFLDVRATTRLPLICQRTLERFELPLDLHQRLGLIRDERDESGLPEGYEPLLVPQDGALEPLAVIEDELILAIPVVPMSDNAMSVPEDSAWLDEVEDLPAPDENMQANPFAALAGLKKRSE